VNIKGAANDEYVSYLAASNRYVANSTRYESVMRTEEMIRVMAIALAAMGSPQHYDLYVEALQAITRLAQAELAMQLQAHINSNGYLH
jgi:hypothetical protein